MSCEAGNVTRDPPPATIIPAVTPRLLIVGGQVSSDRIAAKPGCAARLLVTGRAEGAGAHLDVTLFASRHETGPWGQPVTHGQHTSPGGALVVLDFPESQLRPLGWLRVGLRSTGTKPVHVAAVLEFYPVGER